MKQWTSPFDFDLLVVSFLFMCGAAEGPDFRAVDLMVWADETKALASWKEN